MLKFFSQLSIHVLHFGLDNMGNKLKLMGKDGNSMFLCHTEDELNLDEFETDSDYDENQSIGFDIQNLAASFMGEHECVFTELPPGFQSEHLKLMVTADANALKGDQTSKTEFKAEIMVEHGATDNTQIDDDIYINCPKAGNLKDNTSIIDTIFLQFYCIFLF